MPSVNSSIISPHQSEGNILPCSTLIHYIFSFGTPTLQFQIKYLSMCPLKVLLQLNPWSCIIYWRRLQIDERPSCFTCLVEIRGSGLLKQNTVSLNVCFKKETKQQWSLKPEQALSVALKPLRSLLWFYFSHLAKQTEGLWDFKEPKCPAGHPGAKTYLSSGYFSPKQITTWLCLSYRPPFCQSLLEKGRDDGEVRVALEKWSYQLWMLCTEKAK